MNKQRILEISREENKNRDPAEMDTYKTATFVGTTVGWCFIAFVLILTGILSQKTNYGALSILFSIESGIFITKYIKLKRKHDLIASIVFTIATIGVSILFVLQLTGVIL